jgi:hypothetical protein
MKEFGFDHSVKAQTQALYGAISDTSILVGRGGMKSLSLIVSLRLIRLTVEKGGGSKLPTKCIPP